MDPSFPRGHMIEFAYAKKGMYEEALADVEDGKRAMGGGTWYWSAKSRLYGMWGHQAEARLAFEKLEEINRHQQMDAGPMAWTYASMGNREEALKWLEKSYEQHSNSMTALKVDPTYDALRKEAKFHELLRRVGLGD